MDGISLQKCKTGDLLVCGNRIGDLGDRNGHVVSEGDGSESGLQLGQGGHDGLPCGGPCSDLLLVIGGSDGECTDALCDLLHGLEVPVDLLGLSIGLEDEERLTVGQRVALGLVDGVDGDLVHEFAGCGDQGVCHDCGHTASCIVDGLEGCKHGSGGLGFGGEHERDLGDDSEGTFTSAEKMSFTACERSPIPRIYLSAL